MKPLELLSLDLGQARTGIARASSAAGLAEPLMTVPTKDIFTKLDELISKNKVGAVVVGLPRNLEGHDTEQTIWVRDWVAAAKSKLDVPLFWQDEALTTKIVETKPRSGKYTNPDADSKAAAIILQDFLNTPDSDRLRA